MPKKQKSIHKKLAESAGIKPESKEEIREKSKKIASPTQDEFGELRNAILLANVDDARRLLYRLKDYSEWVGKVCSESVGTIISVNNLTEAQLLLWVPVIHVIVETTDVSFLIEFLSEFQDVHISGKSEEKHANNKRLCQYFKKVILDHQQTLLEKQQAADRISRDAARKARASHELPKSEPQSSLGWGSIEPIKPNRQRVAVKKRKNKNNKKVTRPKSTIQRLAAEPSPIDDNLPEASTEVSNHAISDSLITMSKLPQPTLMIATARGSVNKAVVTDVKAHGPAPAKQDLQLNSTKMINALLHVSSVKPTCASRINFSSEVEWPPLDNKVTMPQMVKPVMPVARSSTPVPKTIAMKTELEQPTNKLPEKHEVKSKDPATPSAQALYEDILARLVTLVKTKTELSLSAVTKDGDLKSTISKINDAMQACTGQADQGYCRYVADLSKLYNCLVTLLRIRSANADSLIVNIAKASIGNVLQLIQLQATRQAWQQLQRQQDDIRLALNQLPDALLIQQLNGMVKDKIQVQITQLQQLQSSFLDLHAEPTKQQSLLSSIAATRQQLDVYLKEQVSLVERIQALKLQDGSVSSKRNELTQQLEELAKTAAPLRGQVHEIIGRSFQETTQLERYFQQQVQSIQTFINRHQHLIVIESVDRCSLSLEKS